MFYAHVEMNYVQSKAAKIWIGAEGRSKIEDPGKVPDKVLREMQDWIKANHNVMERKWNAYGGGGFYVGVDAVSER